MNMTNQRILEPFCGNIVISLTHEHNEFQQLITYRWHMALLEGERLEITFGP